MNKPSLEADQRRSGKVDRLLHRWPHPLGLEDAAQAGEEHNSLEVRRRHQEHPLPSRLFLLALHVLNGIRVRSKTDGKGDAGTGVKMTLAVHIVDVKVLLALFFTMVDDQRNRFLSRGAFMGIWLGRLYIDFELSRFPCTERPTAALEQ